ncbi:MAG: 4Fe-4S dicluster domain-containing protein [Bacteroidetes bacterium]|nr:MAG: 4Fe-4S dicluster domain-containing protein [Bacteroidota bacterium]
MIANFGYKDGSGDYFISIDTDKCNGCGDCVPVCPAGVLEIRDNDFDPMADDKMAAVKESERKKIKYSCSPCKPEANMKNIPCIMACKLDAIVHSW